MKSIEYANQSWNPITGCIPVDCEVKENCWARRMANRLKGRCGYDITHPFKPTIHPDKLEIPYHWDKPRQAVVCFMGDIACAEPDWIHRVLKVISDTPKHRYYILTKQPRKLQPYCFPKNAWVGVTINRRKDFYRINDLNTLTAKVKYISFEPLYEPVYSLRFQFVNWIIIGAQTNPILQPNPLWVESLLEYADHWEIPVFMKDNLDYNGSKRHDFPS